MTSLFVSGADERYGLHLLNLIGSVKANSDVFDGIVAFDLGLSARQRRLLDAIRGVEVREVPRFVPHWSEGRTWKTWIWTHVDADRIFWLDAGATVLRSLAEPLAQVDERGYFVVSQGHDVRQIVPLDYIELYGLSDDLLRRDSVAAGILAFATSGPFFERVIVPTFEDAVQGRSRGFSPDEAERLNQGLDRTDDVVIRDCPRFRHEQTLLSIHLYTAFPEPWVNDVFKYGGWKTPNDHPEQVIWSHRRRGDYRFLWRVPWRASAAPGAWLQTARLRSRWLRSQHAWRLKPSRFLAKLRSLGH